MELDARNLESELRIPVITTEATRGRGMENLRSRIGDYDGGIADKEIKYDDLLEEGLSEIEPLLEDNYTLSKRGVGLLLLQGDAEMENRVRGVKARDMTLLSGLYPELARGTVNP